MKIDLNELKKTKSIRELLEFGILNIDKPSGPTSFGVSDYIRKTLKELGVKKTSHFGTLDPKVTGVLPVALNRACKLTGFFIGEDKEYVGILRVHKEISKEALQKAIDEKFIGKIIQLPPLRSRVKREEREREIKRFEILEKGEKDFLFISEVEGGTYIRKLIHDLGEHLKIGAHMLELRRVRAGIFKENDIEFPSFRLYDLEKAIKEFKDGREDMIRKIIIPAEIISRVYLPIEVKKSETKRLFTGKPLTKREIFCFFSGKIFIGMYEKTGKNQKIFAKPKFVKQPIS